MAHPQDHQRERRRVLTDDGAGRPTDSVHRVNGQEWWRIETNGQGDQIAVTAAKGGSGTLTIKDARGRVTERREYAGPNPTGSDCTPWVRGLAICRPAAGERPTKAGAARSEDSTSL
ncbi:hypothetical protein ABT173_04095 [Streptomyces sp. NPDC001795]|uniref:hypothetical protein n=1 Tax=unclassified Streptomyces TaxID=2593676 RepID=UPI00332B8C5F